MHRVWPGKTLFSLITVNGERTTKIIQRSSNGITGDSAANGGGIFNYYAAAPVLSDVIISGHIATGNSDFLTGAGGGMANYSSYPALTDVTFENNIAKGGYGGAVFNSGSTVTLVNVMIKGNKAIGTFAGGWGGGILCANSFLTLTNVVIADNTATGDDYGGCGIHSNDNGVIFSRLTNVWSTGDTTRIITVNAGGTYSVTVTNSAGCSTGNTIAVSFQTNGIPTVSTGESRLVIAPNPGRETVHITVTEGKLLHTKAMLTDAYGRVVRTVVMESKSQQLSLADLAQGIYILKMENGAGAKVVKE